MPSVAAAATVINPGFGSTRLSRHQQYHQFSPYNSPYFQQQHQPQYHHLHSFVARGSGAANSGSRNPPEDFYGPIPPSVKRTSSSSAAAPSATTDTMKWFGGKIHDSGPQLLSLSPLAIDDNDTGEHNGNDGLYFPPSAPSTPAELKKRSRGRSKLIIIIVLLYIINFY